MSPEPPVEKCEACVSSGGINRASLMPFHGYVAAHHALIARLRAQVVEQRQRAEMAEGAAKAKIEEVEELRAERDAALAKLEEERRTLRVVWDDVFRYLKEDPDNFALRAIVMDYPLGWRPTPEARRVIKEGQK